MSTGNNNRFVSAESQVENFYEAINNSTESAQLQAFKEFAAKLNTPDGTPFLVCIQTLQNLGVVQPGRLFNELNPTEKTLFSNLLKQLAMVHHDNHAYWEQYIQERLSNRIYLTKVAKNFSGTFDYLKRARSSKQQKEYEQAFLEFQSKLIMSRLQLQHLRETRRLQKFRLSALLEQAVKALSEYIEVVVQHRAKLTKQITQIQTAQAKQQRNARTLNGLIGQDELPRSAQDAIAKFLEKDFASYMQDTTNYLQIKVKQLEAVKQTEQQLIKKKEKIDGYLKQSTAVASEEEKNLGKQGFVVPRDNKHSEDEQPTMQLDVLLRSMNTKLEAQSLESEQYSDSIFQSIDDALMDVDPEKGIPFELEELAQELHDKMQEKHDHINGMIEALPDKIKEFERNDKDVTQQINDYLAKAKTLMQEHKDLFIQFKEQVGDKVEEIVGANATPIDDAKPNPEPESKWKAKVAGGLGGFEREDPAKLAGGQTSDPLQYQINKNISEQNARLEQKQADSQDNKPTAPEQDSANKAKNK